MDGSWQICAKTAEEYGRAACESAKMMKWLDPEIELIVCGSSFREMPTFGDWERTVLRHTYEHVDYLSLHSYYADNDGDIAAFLASNVRMDAFIKEVGAICDEIKAEKGSDKDIKLSFDEWNVWYHFKKSGIEPPKWIVARPIEEELYDFADALLVGSMLITLINNADIVKIACLAQLVNTLAPIMTEPGGRAWVQTTYFPFLYTSQNGRGTALKADVNAPSYSCGAALDASYIDCAAVMNGNDITLFLVNKHLGEDIRCEVCFEGFSCENVKQWISLQGFAPDAVNTADGAPVQPVACQGADISNAGGNAGVSFTLKKASWNMIRVGQNPSA
jgi:alpha-N-arabinofuranosidase